MLEGLRPCRNPQSDLYLCKSRHKVSKRHVLPSKVFIPSSFNLAMIFLWLKPSFWNCSINGFTVEANSLALSLRCRLPFWRFSIFPSLTPLAFAARKASLVRSDMRFASYSANAPNICKVRLLASGRSQQTNLTFDSIKDVMKCRFLESLSSLAIKRVASFRLAQASAFTNSGLLFKASLPLPVSTSMNSPTNDHDPPFKKFRQASC